MIHRLLRWLQASESTPRWVLIWILLVMFVGIGVSIWLIIAMQRCGC